MNDNVINIRPGLDAELILTNKVIERKIDALLRACDSLGIAIMAIVVENGEATVFPSQQVYNESLAMVGALECAKDHIKLCCDIEELEEEEL